MSIQSEITRITNKRDLSFQAVASKGVTVPAGSTIDDLPGLIGLIDGSSTGTVYQDQDGYIHLSEDAANAISIVDTTDSGGGLIRTITAVEISDTTAVAADVASGKYFYDASGVKTAGTASGGGTNYLNYATKIVFGKNFPSATPDISLPLVTDAADMFSFDTSTCPYTSIKVTFDKQITALARMCSSYLYSSGLTSVEINGDFSKVSNYQDFVKANSSLQEIKGSPLDFSSVTNANYSLWSGNAQRILTGLTYVRYAENTLKVNHTIFCTALSDDSLVSIANGLQAGAHTLTLQTEMQNRLPLIMGTVANNGTYDVFTKDSQGNVTLQSFIATTKGWTIA